MCNPKPRHSRRNLEGRCRTLPDTTCRGARHDSSAASRCSAICFNQSFMRHEQADELEDCGDGRAQSCHQAAHRLGGSNNRRRATAATEFPMLLAAILKLGGNRGAYVHSVLTVVEIAVKIQPARRTVATRYWTQTCNRPRSSPPQNSTACSMPVPAAGARCITTFAYHLMVISK